MNHHLPAVVAYLPHHSVKTALESSVVVTPSVPERV